MNAKKQEMEAKIREEVLEKIVGAAAGSELLAIPGVGELLEDFFSKRVDADTRIVMSLHEQHAKTVKPFLFPKEVHIAIGDPNFDASFIRFMENLKRIVEAADEKLSFNRSVDFTVGKKYIRVLSGDIVPESPEKLHNRSAYCFVNILNGDILKPAGWAGPAKHARGNIYNPADKVMDCCSRYGVAYLR